MNSEHIGNLIIKYLLNKMSSIGMKNCTFLVENLNFNSHNLEWREKLRERTFIVLSFSETLGTSDRMEIKTRYSHFREPIWFYAWKVDLERNISFVTFDGDV